MCSVPGKPWQTLPDPLETPAAHLTVLVHFYVFAAASLLLSLMLMFCLRTRPHHWMVDEDEDGNYNGAYYSETLHFRFFYLSTVGYGVAAAATQVYPGDRNWAMVTGKVFIILAWTCLLAVSCGAAHALCPEKVLTATLWLCAAVVVLASLVELVVPGDRHFQGFMYCLAAAALICAIAWVVVHNYYKPKRDSREPPNCFAVFRFFWFVLAAVSFIIVAIMEPGCGYGGYQTCYANCGGPGMHFWISLIPLIFFYIALVWMQGFNPFPMALLPLPCCQASQTEEEEPEKSTEPAASQVPPSIPDEESHPA